MPIISINLMSSAIDDMETAIEACPKVILESDPKVLPESNKAHYIATYPENESRLANLSAKASNFIHLIKYGQSYKIWRKTACHLNGEVSLWKPGLPLFTFQELSCRLLRVTTFNIQPSIYVDSDTKKPFKGYEYQMLDLVLSGLGVTNVRYQVPSDGGMWGSEVKPGVFSGMYKDLYEGKTDIGMANSWLGYVVVNYFTFTQPHTFSNVCFLYRKEPPLAQWTTIYRSFDGFAWLITVSALVSSCLIALAYSHYKPSHETKKIKKSHIVLFHVSICVNQPSIVTRFIHTHTSRLYVGCFMLMFFILTHAYIAGFISAIAVPKEAKPMDTIEDLAESDIPIAGFLTYTKQAVEASTDPTLMKLAKKGFGAYFNQQEALEKMSNGELIMGESRVEANYELRKRFKEFGQTNIHITRECLFTYPVVFILPKNSPYITVLDIAIQRVLESGIYSKYFKDTLDETAKIAAETQQQALWKLFKYQRYQVDDVWVVFALLILMYCVSIIVLIGELNYK